MVWDMLDVVDNVELDLVSPGWAGGGGCGRLTGPALGSKPLLPEPPGRDTGPLPVLRRGELAPFRLAPLGPRLNLGEDGVGVDIPAEAGVGGCTVGVFITLSVMLGTGLDELAKTEGELEELEELERVVARICRDKGPFDSDRLWRLLGEGVSRLLMVSAVETLDDLSLP